MISRSRVVRSRESEEEIAKGQSSWSGEENTFTVTVGKACQQVNELETVGDIQEEKIGSPGK